MKKSDWYGLGTSIILHLILILGLSFMNLGASEPEPIGYIEVDFGPVSEGRSVQRAPEVEPEEVEQQDEEPQEEEQPEAAPPEEAKPVELPDQEQLVVDEEKVDAPETETISPVQQTTEAEVVQPEPQPETHPVRPLGGGVPEGSGGEETGDEGPGNEEVRTAPFQIEGLNRTTVFSPLPAYAEKVNADIKVRITVDPQGRVLRTFPLLKGSPALEKAVQDALKRWRFNALPPNAPQVDQTGTITFRFRLE